MEELKKRTARPTMGGVEFAEWMAKEDEQMGSDGEDPDVALRKQDWTAAAPQDPWAEHLEKKGQKGDKDDKKEKGKGRSGAGSSSGTGGTWRKESWRDEQDSKKQRNESWKRHSDDSWKDWKEDPWKRDDKRD